MQNVLYYKRICRQNGTCSCNRYPKLEGKYPLHIKLLAPIPFLLFQQFDALYVLKIKELQNRYAIRYNTTQSYGYYDHFFVLR